MPSCRVEGWERGVGQVSVPLHGGVAIAAAGGGSWGSCNRAKGLLLSGGSGDAGVWE